MADEEKASSSSEGEGEGGKKKGLLADWKGMKGWQKAGVLIGGAALAITVLIYWNSQNGQQNGSSSAPGLLGGLSNEPSQYSGVGDTYPSVPTPAGSGAGGVPPVVPGLPAPVPTSTPTPTSGSRGDGAPYAAAPSPATHPTPVGGRYAAPPSAATKPKPVPKVTKGKVVPLRNRVTPAAAKQAALIKNQEMVHNTAIGMFHR